MERNKRNLEKEAIEKFEAYASGVARLKELGEQLNSMHTKKYSQLEKEIRKKLKNVSLISEIEHDIRELKLRIAGVDVDYEKAMIDKRQDKKIQKLDRGEKILDLKFGVGFEELPKLKRKTNFLNRLFGRESQEIEELNYKFDRNRLDFNNKLLRELAESKAMIQEEKFELKKQLLDTLAVSLRKLNEEKEESDKKIMREIDKLNSKIDSEKKDMNEELISKIVQLRTKIDDSKKELQKNIEKQIEIIKEVPVVETLAKPSMEIKMEIPKENKPILITSKLEEKGKNLSAKYSFVGNSHLPEIPEDRVFSLPRFSELSSFSEQKLSEFKPLPKLEISKLHVIEKPISIKENKIATPKQLSIKIEKKLPDNKFEINKIQNFPLPKTREIREIPKISIEKTKNRKIPQKKFFKYDEFETLSSHIKDLKQGITIRQNKILKNNQIKNEGDQEILKCSENLGKIRENLSQMRTNFSFKGL